VLGSVALLHCAWTWRQHGPVSPWRPDSLGVDVSFEIVGEPSIPAAQLTHESCRPAFRPLAHSLHHQGDVEDQNRERRRRQGWEPVRHLRKSLTRFGRPRGVVAACRKCDSNLRVPGGTLPASQAASPARSAHTSGLGQVLSKPHGYNARAAPTVEQPILATTSPWPHNPMSCRAASSAGEIRRRVRQVRSFLYAARCCSASPPPSPRSRFTTKCDTST
jgi:hypothetical protein